MQFSNSVHAHTAGVGGGDRDTQCTSKLQVVERPKGIHPAHPYTAVDGVILAI